MAEGRFVSRSISTSEQLASVSMAAALLFSWSIPHLDVDGRLNGSPMWLKTNIVPLRDEITLKLIPKLLEELGGAIDRDGLSLVVWYETRRQQALFFTGFDNHQTLRRDREGKSRLPALAEATRILAGVVPGRTPGSGPGSTPGVAPTSTSAKRLQVEGEGEVEVQEKFKTPPPARAREVERPKSESEERLAPRLASDADRNALTALILRVPNADAWLAEMAASLDGMGGHQPVTPAQLGEALRDFVANGALANPGLKHFRAYVRRASLPEREPSGNGRGGSHDAPDLAAIGRRMDEEEAARKARSHV